MPYTHYNTDERNPLQAMEGIGLPKYFMPVMLKTGGRWLITGEE
jgi:hypothetical protein